MTGDIGVHNDAPFVNGKIGEDCGIGGAVTIKELKGLPDCGCGDCNGIVDFGSSVGSPFVALGVENRNLSGKDGSVNRDTVDLAAKGCIDGVGADRKEIIVNGRAEGDDQPGNCVGQDAKVQRRENGVPENGDCSANGHVPEIEVDVVDGKHGDVVVERNSEEVETKHNDSPFVNGKIGEDCGMGGAVTIKELKGLPDCVCGECNRIVNVGSSVGSPFVYLRVENRNLGGKDGSVNGDTVRLAVKGCVNVVGTDRKEIVVNGRAEGDDQTGNCVSEDAEVKRRENGVRENGDCDANGHVPEIEVDVVEGKHGDVVVESNYEEVETKRDAEENRENGVLEDGDCGADGSVAASKVGVLENNDCDVKAENVKEADITDHNDDIDCNNVDCSLNNGVAREESPSKTQDSKVEDTIVEEQNGKAEVMEYVDGLIGVGSQSEFVEGLSRGVEPHPAADPEGTSEELLIDQAEPGMQEGLTQTGGSTVVESSDVQMHDIEKSHDEIQNADKTDAASVVAAKTDSEDIHDQQIECAIQPVPEQDHISESDLCSSACVEPHKVSEADVEVLSADDKVEKVDEETEEERESHQVVILQQEVEAGDVSVKDVSTAKSESAIEGHRDDKVEKVDEETEEERGSHQDVILLQEVKAGDVSVKDVSTAKSESAIEGHHDDASTTVASSVKDVSTAKSESAIEGHHDDASTTVASPESTVTLSEVPSSNENKDNGDIVRAECPVASNDKDLVLDDGNIQGDSVDVSSLPAKEEPAPTEVDNENKVMDSDPTVTTSETRAEKNSTAVDASSCCFADNAGAEAVICFGSFSQREFSDISSEDVIEKKEDQHTVPELDTEQSSSQAEVVDVTPQSNTKLAEVPVVASPKEQTQFSEVDKKAFNYLIKIPRFEDDYLKSKISDAQLQVDEKTKSRDSIKSEMNGKKTIYKESSEKFGAAVMEEKAARELLKSKRRDIDSVQNEINKVKNAMSLGEIDSEISDMERSIQHETLPLKEERELVNKIRKLKQLRGQMSSSIGGQDELQEALKNKEETEERLKILKKDADSLRENCLKAEAVTKATKKIYYDDSEKLRELQTRFKEADEIRQDAYVQLQSLKKQLYEKNKPLWKYRDDMKMATDLASKGVRESLSQFCIEQVVTFMEAWNKSNEFREEYLKSNARRTLRRLGTAEGRSLGPNEEAPSVPPIVNERPAPEKSFPSLATPKLETVVKAVEVESSTEKVLRNDADKKKRKPKAKNSVKSPPEIETVLAILERDEIVEETKELKVTEEERELARKAEELRKKEEAEMLLEQRRVEEKAKAKEALERKRRNAEKATARAAQKSQKEAEQKEKEREKRAKKKEKKRLGSNASSDEIPEGESHATSEVAVEAAPAEPEVREKPAPTRRPAKPSHFPKHTKIAPIPAPLRNRAKRKMQPWMWVLLAALLVFVLFLAGNARNLF